MKTDNNTVCCVAEPECVFDACSRTLESACYTGFTHVRIAELGRAQCEAQTSRRAVRVGAARLGDFL